MKKSAFLSLAAVCSLFGEGDESLFELERTLKEATQIATLSKMNADYVPSVVSVQSGEKLKALGANTLYDALEMLPGVQMQVNNLGENIAVFRGFKNPNSKLTDKVKLMIDGISVNSDSFGTAGHVMNFPLDLVEKIEVMRGPGSTLYGAGAFYGAINVITKVSSGSKKSECAEAFIGGGSWYYKSIGAVGCKKIGDLKIASDVYYKASNKQLELDSRYTDARTRPFPRDYTSDEDFGDLGAGIKVSGEKLSLSARLKKSWQGAFYGTEERLEPSTAPGQTNQVFTAELAYKESVGEGKLELSAGVRDFSHSVFDRTRDYTYNTGRLPGYAYDYSVRTKLAETQFFAEALYLAPEYKNHNISVNANISHTRIRDNYLWSSIEDWVFQNPANEEYSEEPALKKPYNNYYIKDGTTRGGGGVSLEDLYEVTKDIDLVMGARVEKYNDLKTHANFRVGIAARWLENSLITKLIYSTGHRAPSFVERYGNEHVNFRAGDSGIESEEIREYEAVAIYKPDISNYFSITAYYAELDKVIDVEEFLETLTGHLNYPKRISRGLELEYTYTPNTKNELSLGASFNDTSYLNTDNGEAQKMPDISPVMYKASYLFMPLESLSVGVKYFYQSQTAQNTTYSRDTKIPAQQRVDLTLKYDFSKNMSAYLSIYNLQDKLQRMPSYYYRNTLSRNDGMVREGRNFLAKLTYRF